MTVKVLIQAEAGSSEKIRYDEKRLNPIGAIRMSRPYPYAYGFVVATTAADGDNADCYVISGNAPRAGGFVECEVVGLLEQIESGEPDHKLLVVVAGQAAILPDCLLESLEAFIYGVFSDFPESTVSVGPIRGQQVAETYLSACQDHRL